MKSRWKIVQKTAPFSLGAKKNALRVSKMLSQCMDMQME